MKEQGRVPIAVSGRHFDRQHFKAPTSVHSKDNHKSNHFIIVSGIQFVVCLEVTLGKVCHMACYFKNQLQMYASLIGNINFTRHTLTRSYWHVLRFLLYRNTFFYLVILVIQKKQNKIGVREFILVLFCFVLFFFDKIKRQSLASVGKTQILQAI